MNHTMKSKLAGLVVAATFAAAGTAALANSDDLIPAEGERHGQEISTLAHETESGPGKGAIISAAASAHGAATSEAAKARHAAEDTDKDEDTDTDKDEDTDTDTAKDTHKETGTHASGKPADPGAKGLETAVAAKSDGKAFGSAKAEAAKAKHR